MLKTEIANLALRHLAVTSYLSDVETDNSLEAKIIRRFFQVSLDDILEKHYWTFATKTAVLALEERDPEKRFNFSYRKPVDALVIRELACHGEFMEPSLNHYREHVRYFEERTLGTMQLLYTNVENAHAKYTQRLTENTNFPSYFGRAVAGQLAMDIGPAIITGNWPKVMNAVMTMASNEVGAGIAEDIARNPQKSDSYPPMITKRFM
jgi:hypothetical protein